MNAVTAFLTDEKFVTKIITIGLAIAAHFGLPKDLATTLVPAIIVLGVAVILGHGAGDILAKPEIKAAEAAIEAKIVEKVVDIDKTPQTVSEK